MIIYNNQPIYLKQQFQIIILNRIEYFVSNIQIKTQLKFITVQVHIHSQIIMDYDRQFTSLSFSIRNLSNAKISTHLIYRQPSLQILFIIMELKETTSREEKHQKPIKKGEAACMDIIKRMNGFKQSLWKDLEKIDTIQLVLEDFGSMTVFNRFRGLKSLTLINVGISTIEGINECVKLQQLWLNENSISKIQGLQKNVNLKSLHLSHNQIKKIEGLGTLSKLQTFWICDNQIQTLQNFEGLKSLKQLWIASNQIETIKTSLDSLTQLTDLNLSGNKLCSFKEILNLNRLPNLKMLSLYDPHFGENPICTLSNYQTYMLYHLRSITKLDTLHLSDQAKIFAQSTYMRKKMYYNMRIKTIERHFSTLQKLVKKASQIKIDSLNEDLQSIYVKLKDPEAKTTEIQEIYNMRVEQLLHVREVYQAVKKRLLDISKVSIRKLLTELETGGNIRLQQGKPEDKWYKSCEDLIKSRYNQSDLANMGISGINFKRVLRIHNRFLKQKFEEKIESIIDVSSSSYKKNIEYLFFGADPSSPQEVDHIMEQGFRSSEQSKKLGLCPYTPLVHTLLAGDLPRINSYVKSKINDSKFNKNFIKKRGLRDLVIYPPGWLFVCKVPMIKSANDEKYPYFNPEISPSDILKQQPIEAKESEYALVRTKESDQRVKIWFMLDNSLVLPQYYVQFDYILSSNNQNKVADFGEAIGLLQTENDEFIGSMSPQQINQIYNNLVSQIGNYQFENIEDCDNSNLEIQAADLDRIDLGHIKSTLINYFKYCLCRSNLYHSFNQNNTLQPSEEFDLNKLKISNQASQNLKYLNFSNFKIKDISFLKDFPNLETAILSSNLISKVNDIQKCPSIKILDLSRNSIQSLIGLSGLKELNYLDISHNDIQSVDALKLLELNQQLSFINILFNPFKDPKEAEKLLFKLGKSLKTVNYIDISSFNSKTNNQKNDKEINDVMIQKYLVSHKLIQVTELVKLQSLHINHEKLISMKGIEQLVNLRRLNLSHNKIQKIQFIENCKLLEEVNLQDNLISRITHLEKLIFLKNLQLGKNKIFKVEGIETLINLTQLSLEDNQLSILQGFPQLKCLMELYLGNNKIVDPKQVKNLKDLQKLIILDMSGNPLSKDSSYRIFTLYVLKKLKVLDGISIEGFQQQQAKQHFTGRLTEEILRQKLEGGSTQNVKQLDLRNSKLKDFDDMFTTRHFPNLTELDISSNEFTTMKMLGNLPTLSILVLQHNKIDSLYCSSDMNHLKGLNGCQNLYILDLSHNYLKDFNGLQFCKLGQLKILKASRNQIIRIDCLQNLKQLKQLDVNHNKIRQFDPTSFQVKNVIKCLKIDDNVLKNFNNIQKLTKLHYLFAHSNRIQEFHDIDRLQELDHLRQLQLNGNSLCRRGGYRMTMVKKLPNLMILDGKDISNDQRSQMQIHQPPMIPQNYNQMPINQRQGSIRVSSLDFGGVFTNNKVGMMNPNNFGNQGPR